MNAVTQSAGTTSSKPPGSTNKLNAFGIIALGVVFWVSSQNATGNTRKMINGFLGVLLLSIVLMKWSTIKPIFFK